jgi:site-specific DNA-methyltransferase (adenine-specific)
MELYITNSSNEWDVILDPFAGSWTTWIACQNTNRNYIMIEKDENYFKIANKRLLQWKTG